jgi:hypothetical protein
LRWLPGCNCGQDSPTTWLLSFVLSKPEFQIPTCQCTCAHFQPILESARLGLIAQIDDSFVQCWPSKTNSPILRLTGKTSNSTQIESVEPLGSWLPLSIAINARDATS